MEKLIVDELCKNLKWYEKIVVKLWKSVTIKIYKLGITYGYNNK